MDVVFIHVTFGFFTGARKRFNVIYCFCFLFTTLNKSLGEGGVGVNAYLTAAECLICHWID